MTEQSEGLVLLVEDNASIAEMCGALLERRGYRVDYAWDGHTGLKLAMGNCYDAIILDLMLPGIDGIEVCRRLREEAHVGTPVLMLTARDTLDDKITGLDAGADDYMIKPFEPRELVARIQALIRRQRRQSSPLGLQVADLELDTGTMIVTRGSTQLNLSPIGIKLLKILLRESPNVVNRLAIEREVWGDVLPDSDTLRSHMYNLRKVIDKPFDKPLVHTVHGTGYRIADLEHSDSDG